MPQPKSGRITRSPFDVERMIQIDSLDVLFVLGQPNRPVPDPARAPESSSRVREKLRGSGIAPRHPISTVSSPSRIVFGGASATKSPWRAAGSPLISTVGLPTATTPPTCGTRPLNSGQAWKSAAARHAGGRRSARSRCPARARAACRGSSDRRCARPAGPSPLA